MILLHLIAVFLKIEFWLFKEISSTYDIYGGRKSAMIATDSSNVR